MGQFAYLAPVGPFAGLSNAARQKINDAFPTLSLAEIEGAAATFLLDLEASAVEPRLSEAREELNIFARELARFEGALTQVRRHRLDHAIIATSVMICGENKLDDLERALSGVRTAMQQTSRALPPGRSQLASRRLIARLETQVNDAGLLASAGSDPLLSLVDLIFDDLMVGADPAGALREWHQSKAGIIDQEPASLLWDLLA